MLTEVDAIAPSGAELAMHMGSITDLIQIVNIDGLGPVKADLTSSSKGAQPGAAITGKHVGQRNIVMDLRLNPDWDTQTIEELRLLLYAYFFPTSNVTLRLISTHLPTCLISGVVEDITPDIFAKDPQVQVSIICADPAFVAVDATAANGVVVADASFVDVVYEGTMDVGIRLDVNSSVARPTYTGALFLTFYSDVDATHKGFAVNPITVDATHYFELYSVPGQKAVNSYSGGVATNLFNKKVDPVIWPYLTPGLNRLSVKAFLAGQTWAMSYNARFGGM